VLQFFCFLLIIVVAEIAAVVWAYSNSDKLENIVESSVRATVQEEYGIVDTRTATFDAIQKGVPQSCFASTTTTTTTTTTYLLHGAGSFLRC
jgi:Flp pilus assembly protein TadG